MLFVFATGFPPFEVQTDVNLGIHMLQHVIIAIAGVFIGYPLYKSHLGDRTRSARIGLLGLAAVIGLLITWHLPYLWDAAVASLSVHVVEHFCFLIIGILIGLCVPMLPDNFKVIALVLAISGHMFYGFALFLLNTQVYPLYPLAQQQLLGIALFAPSPAYIIGYLYFSLMRESRRLEAIENPKPTVSRNNVRVNRSTLLAAFSLIMIAVLVGYFAITGAVIFSASYNQGTQVSYVYIQEGPVAWQYTPTQITVVLGVNNTVTWISHSFAYDTITSKDGLFSSGPVAPGSSYTYVFTKAGTYNYYCQYHLWMQGTVVVKSQ